MLRNVIVKKMIQTLYRKPLPNCSMGMIELCVGTKLN